MTMENAPSSAAADRRKLGAGAIASLVGVAVLVIFLAQNREDVTVEFLFWEFTWPIWLLRARRRGGGCLGVVWTWRASPSRPTEGAPRRPSELMRAAAPR